MVQPQQHPPLLPVSSKPTAYPPESIQIVTWYMADALSFASLVHLLIHQPQYQGVTQLELVAPSGQVDEELVDRLADHIKKSDFLREVTLYTVKIPHLHRSSLSNPREIHYLKQLEQAANQVECCSIKLIPTGDPSLLCSSLTGTIQLGRYRRHLAVDGVLLQGISREDLAQLAFDLSWDRSIHVCLWKDVPPDLLTVLLPKLVHTPLQTLKIVYDPASMGNSRRLMDATPLDTLPLQQMLANPKLKTLQRLYLGYVRLDPSNTHQLMEGVRSSSSLKQLEFGLCQFESGTARHFLRLLQQAKEQRLPLKDIQFHYPILSKK